MLMSWQLFEPHTVSNTVEVGGSPSSPESPLQKKTTNVRVLPLSLWGCCPEYQDISSNRKMFVLANIPVAGSPVLGPRVLVQSISPMENKVLLVNGTCGAYPKPWVSSWDVFGKKSFFRIAYKIPSLSTADSATPPAQAAGGDWFVCSVQYVLDWECRTPASRTQTRAMVHRQLDVSWKSSGVTNYKLLCDLGKPLNISSYWIPHCECAFLKGKCSRNTCPYYLTGCWEDPDSWS